MNLFRPDVERIEGYTPGEQPQESGWVKLNTNENPYPPSPRVVEAICSAARGRLNVYPDPLATRFCQQAAELFDLSPDWSRTWVDYPGKPPLAEGRWRLALWENEKVLISAHFDVLQSLPVDPIR